ncbi:MAG: alpha-L-fucosidase [Chloroflexi bacterium]|nr:alpha-L-fucosidase [Chloroflexota bacterium]
MIRRINSLSLFAALWSGLTLNAAETPRPYPARLQWWAEARFGMFIHWGPVSLKETEISWSRANTNPKCPNHGQIPAAVYDSLYKSFNPTNFDARQWVAIAKAAGMKYMVLTAKHCDGFLLWDSKADDYNIMHTPFKRDVCAELAQAAHEQGMRIGWYFSPMDWRDPDCRNEHNDRFIAKMQAELRELLTHYGKIDLLWFDCDGREVPWSQETTYALVKKLQPEIVINNRLDMGAGHNPGSPGSIGPQADYFTPEQWIGGYEDQHPWESCMTTSRRGQWSWGGREDGVKPHAEVMEMLIRCAGGDGNVLLNVGPMPTGEIGPEQADRVKEMGAWLAKYGESIYGTRGGPFKPGHCGVSTRQGNTVYLHLSDWTDDPLKLPALAAKVVGSRVLTGGQAEVRQTAAGLEIAVAEGDRQPLDTIVALELDSEANRIPAVDVPGPVSLTTQAKATASNVCANQAEYGADKAVDGRNDTRWATDSGIKAAWLEVDLGKPVTFSRAAIRQAFPELGRIRKFAIEYWTDDQWKPCYQGENLGAKLAAKFTPVTARRVRLNLIESTDGPTLWEFQLYATGN